MKVLHVYKSYYPDTRGGVEKFIETLTKATTVQGIKNTLATTTPGFSYQNIQENLAIDYSHQWLDIASTPISWQLLRKYRQFAREFDLIHYHFPWPFADICHWSLGAKKPTLVSYHSDIIKQKYLNYLYAPLMRTFLNSADAIVAASPNYAKTSPVLKKYAQKVSIIPYGIAPEYYPQLTEAVKTKIEKKFGQDFFLSLGVLRYYKGLEYLIRAAKNQDFRIVIAGTGPEEVQLKKLCADEKITNVVFTGEVSEEEKMALLTLCKAVVSSAHLRSEAFCISLAEGLMCAKPLISTEIGTGTSFVNLNNVTGFVVAPQNPMQLAEAMKRLSQDKVLCEQFSQNAAKRYLELFSADRMCGGYLELYRRLVSDYINPSPTR